MDMDSYTQVCRRIVERCQRNHWYGPDRGAENHRNYFDADGKLHTRKITHDYRSGFEFPPATEEQLQATEEALGFPLPPMLRALYTYVANGGFGPDFGITGASGGFYFGEDGRYKTVDMCTDSNSSVEYIDLATYENRHGNSRVIELRRSTWPAHFLHLCYTGCGEDYYLDGKSERVYHLSYGHDDEQGFTYLFFLKADSLVKWLEHWLQDETMPWGIPGFGRT